MGHLQVIAGIAEGARHELAMRTRIGRAPDNDIVLDDHLASRYHAEIIDRGIQWILRDLGSKNGTRVNEQPVTETQLRRGDRVQIGRTVFQFDLPSDQKIARFSDKIIHMTSAHDSQMKFLDGAAETTLKTEAIELLTRLGDVMDCSSDELADLVNKMLSDSLELLGGEAGAVLLRTSTGEATPLVALGSGDAIVLSREATRMVLSDGRSLVTDSLAGEPDRTQPTAPRRTMMVPLVRHNKVFGAMVVERLAGKEYTIQDLALFRALGRLLSGCVHQAIQLDKLVVGSLDASAEPIIGESQSTLLIRERIQRLASADATVLLQGETGTGKELVARAIHAASPRARDRWVVIDCSAIPPNLMESELFGHEAGAFTGATRLKHGKIEMADGGTLFLDEIGELQLELQPKLLRFMEERVFYRIGGLRPIAADVRIIAATNRNLEQAVRDGRFRQDLLFRLNVLQLELSPLRTRGEDIRPLVNYFAPRLAARLGKPFLGVLDEAWRLLEQYTWPGNVRELRHSLERALILSDDGILGPEHFQLVLPETVREHTHADSHANDTEQTQSGGASKTPRYPRTIAEAEADAIRRALRFAKGNRIQAAQILKIHRNTLAKKIQDYSIEV